MTFHIKPSFYFFIFISILHGGALLLLFFIDLPIWLIILMAAVIVVYYFYVILRFILLQMKWSVRQFKLGINNEVSMALGKKFAPNNGVLQPYYFMNRFLIILHVKITENFFPLPIILFKDSESEENLRRLRAWLWMYGHTFKDGL